MKKIKFRTPVKDEDDEPSALVEAEIESEDTEPEAELADLVENGSQERPKKSWKVKILGALRLIVECPFGNYHYRWHRICACAYTVHIKHDGHEWHGGILDLATGAELHPCSHCSFEAAQVSRQWPLTEEERVLVGSWRQYRATNLERFGDSLPYKYAVLVELDGIKEQLFTRTQGLAALRDAKFGTLITIEDGDDEATKKKKKEQLN